MMVHGLKPIKTPADHLDAVEGIDSLLTAKMGTPEGDHLDVLTTLVEVYETLCGLNTCGRLASSMLPTAAAIAFAVT